MGKERDQFIATMTAEGMGITAIRSILADAHKLQRYAELACNSEAADRDRIACPGVKLEARCLCDKFNGEHESIPRYALWEFRAEGRIIAACKKANVTPIFNGDPRGAVVKLRVPSGKTDDWGREGICVP